MGKTTLTVSDDTLDRFRDAKGELDDLQPDVPDHTNETFLQALLDTWERVGQIPEDGPENITDALADDEVAIIGTEHAVMEELAAKMEDSGGLTYDDVVQATRKALREELPDEVLGR
jgi:hypothetical protein